MIDFIICFPVVVFLSKPNLQIKFKYLNIINFTCVQNTVLAHNNDNIIKSNCADAIDSSYRYEHQIRTSTNLKKNSNKFTTISEKNKLKTTITYIG